MVSQGLAVEPVWRLVDGSEFSSVLQSPFGLKWERMGMAPAKGLESKQRAELNSSSKYALWVMTMPCG